MVEQEIKANIRESAGKRFARRIRRDGEIPCVLYGVEKDSVSLSLNRREVEKLLSGLHAVIVVNYGDVKQRSVIKEIQYHPVKGSIIHVDLQRVKAGQEISVSVPLKFIGTSEGIKLGGVFQALKSELDVSCLPKYLPSEIEIEISGLNIGDALHLSDLNFENLTFKADPSTTLCSVAIPKIIEEVVPEGEEEEEEELDEDEAEPEVISKSKKDEEGEGEAKDSN